MVVVSYYCPRCGAVAELERDAYLADKSVTPFPLEGWTYADPDDDLEGDDWDGVRLVCGAAAEGLTWSHPPGEGTTGEEGDGRRGGEPGCGEACYLNFVRFEGGREVEGESAASERVRLAETRGPDSPGGPSGPGFSR